MFLRSLKTFSVLSVGTVACLLLYQLYLSASANFLPKLVTVTTFDETNETASISPTAAIDKKMAFEITTNILVPPSKKPYRLNTFAFQDTSEGQAELIRRILGNKTNGFFVEAGALDGETYSNTLYMERHLNWTGLLVEPDPRNFQQLQAKNRKAWTARACLSDKPYSYDATFHQDFALGKIVSSESKNKHKTSTIKVKCVPLSALLAVLNVTVVDFFSLDLEGFEYKVLKTIPFDKVIFRTLSVEFAHVPEGKRPMINFMESKGYRYIGDVGPPFHTKSADIILVHKSVEVNVPWGEQLM